MFNVRSKYFFIFLFISVIFLSCSNQDESKNKDTAEISAKDYVQMIDSALNKNDYSQAIELINELNVKFPENIDERKTTLLSYARAMEGLIRDSIIIADQQLVSTQNMLDSLKTYFVTVHDSKFSDYLIERSIKNMKTSQTSYVQPRYDEETHDWNLIISVPGNSEIYSIELNGVNVKIKDSKERTVKSGNFELINLSGHEINLLAETLSNASETTVPLKIQTQKGENKIVLTSTMQTAIWRTYCLASTWEQNRLARLHRELLERKLIVAQNQIVNFNN